MSIRTISNLVEIYSPKLAAAGKTPPYSSVIKLYEEFLSEVHLLKHKDVEDEILSYLKDAISSGKWERYYKLWFIAMLEHPSEKYINYLLCILQKNDGNFPHWKALDVLAYMPQTISTISVPKLTEIIEMNNPAWSEEALKKAFETLVWIGNEEGIDFISRACNSPVERISNMAKYWVDWLADDDDDEEDE